MRLALALACALASGAVAAPIGYSVRSNDDQNLYRIDLSTGVATSLGLIVPFGDAEGLAFVGNQLYGIGGTQDELWNLTAPPGALVGSTGDRSGVDAGLAYDPVGQRLYNLNADIIFGPGPLTYITYLYTVSLIDGSATLVGSDDGYNTGMAINAGGQAFGLDALQTDGLYSIDLLTGASTFIGGFGIGDTDFYAGADFDAAGILWALFDNGAIYTIDTATGLATFRSFVNDGQGGFLDGFEGLAIDPSVGEVPEPGTAVLLAAGLLIAAIRARRSA